MQAAIRPVRAFRRTVAGAAAAALLGGLTACGGDGGTSTPGPDANAVTQPKPVFALAPATYDDPYSGALAATGTMPKLALVLASGLAERAGRSGEADSPAAELSADLTHLLTAHVYSLGVAVTTIYETSPTSGKSESALQSVDVNAETLAKLLGKLTKQAGVDTSGGDDSSDGAGPSGGRGNTRPLADPDPKEKAEEKQAEKQADEDEADDGKKKKQKAPKEPPFDLSEYDFLAEWRDHVTALVDYAIAAKERNSSDKGRARADLDDFRREAARYFRAIADGRLSSGAVSGDLSRYVSSLTAALDALGSRDGDGFIALRETAGELPEIATRLAAGLASATDREGSVYDEAAELRAELTGLFTGHSYLSSTSYLAGFANIEAGAFTSAPYRRVQVSLDDNSKALAALVREVADPRAEFEFLQGWRFHLRDLENYASGLLRGDLAARTAAMEGLEPYLGKVAKFFRSLSSGGITPAEVERRLKAEVEAQAGVIDALHETFAPEPS